MPDLGWVARFSLSLPLLAWLRASRTHSVGSHAKPAHPLTLLFCDGSFSMPKMTKTPNSVISKVSEQSLGVGGPCWVLSQSGARSFLTNMQGIFTIKTNAVLMMSKVSCTKAISTSWCWMLVLSCPLFESVALHSLYVRWTPIWNKAEYNENG